MGTRERNEWVNIYNNSTKFVSEYAKTNYLEDFAETLTVYWEYEVSIRRAVKCKDRYTTLESIKENSDLSEEKIFFMLERIKPSEGTLYRVRMDCYEKT